MKSTKIGRPIKYDNQFYLSIIEEHKTLSLTKMAKKHNVCLSTITKWVARGKEILNNETYIN